MNYPSTIMCWMMDDSAWTMVTNTTTNVSKPSRKRSLSYVLSIINKTTNENRTRFPVCVGTMKIMIRQIKWNNFHWAHVWNSSRLVRITLLNWRYHVPIVLPVPLNNSEKNIHFLRLFPKKLISYNIFISPFNHVNDYKHRLWRHFFRRAEALSTY